MYTPDSRWHSLTQTAQDGTGLATKVACMRVSLVESTTSTTASGRPRTKFWKQKSYERPDPTRPTHARRLLTRS